MEVLLKERLEPHPLQTSIQTSIFQPPMSQEDGAIMVSRIIVPLLYVGRPVSHWKTGRRGTVVEFNPRYCSGSDYMRIKFADDRTVSRLEWRRIGAFVLEEENPARLDC